MYSFNTQPPKGGWAVFIIFEDAHNSFNTQPPEGGWLSVGVTDEEVDSFNTQPPEGGWVQSEIKNYRAMLFQHTAA